MTRFYARLALPALIGLLAAPAFAQSARLDPTTGESLPGALTAQPADVAEEAPASFGGPPLTLLGRLADGETRGIALVGNTLYRSNGGYLEMLDVSGAGAPTVLGRFLAAQGVVQGVSVQGTLAAVPVSRGVPYATRGSIQLVDVANPAAPVGIGQVSGRSFFDAVISGTTVYGASGGGGLRLFDITTPATPVARGFVTVSGGSVLSVALSGTTAYVAAGNAGLGIIDVANAATPTLTSAFPVGGFATRVAVVGTRAYVSVNAVGLVVVDVSNPAAPVELGRFAIDSSQIRSVAVSGTTAYVGRDDGLVSLDVSNPAAITQLGTLAFGVSGSGQSIVLSGTTAYVGNRFSGVRVVNVANPAALSQTRLIDNGGFSFKVNMIGTRVYIADLIGQVRIIDIANPAAPVELGRIRGVPNTDGVDVLGTTAYVVNRSAPPAAGVTRVDISNPAAPVVLGFTPTARSAYGVDVDGQTVFVAAGVNGAQDGTVIAANGAGGGFAVLDEEATGNQSFGLTVVNGRAYVATFGSGLSILDVSNPAAMTPLSLNSVGNFSSAVEVDGTTAYLADSEVGNPKALSIIDVANPAAPTLIGTVNGFNGGTSVDVALGNQYAYAVVDMVGLYQYDVANPALPTSYPVVPTADRATGVDAENLIVVLVDAGAGLWVFQSPVRVAAEGGASSAPLAIATFPNPASSAAQLRITLPEAAPVTVSVFSTLGREVAHVAAGTLGAGAHVLGLDTAAWPAGVYVVRVTAGGQTATSRLTVAR